MFDDGNYIPTTPRLDASNFNELKALVTQLYEQLNYVALAVNSKSNGVYDDQETFAGKKILRNETSQDASSPLYNEVYHKYIDFGALPNATTKNVAHNIKTGIGLTLFALYGGATDPTGTFSYLPLPYASPVLADNIEVWADGTNVYVKTGKNRTAYTRCKIVIEYIYA